MLVDALTAALESSRALEAFWGKLDAREDAALGIASSARPFMAAARFTRTPQSTLVLVPGEEAAATFARNVAAYVGEEKVLRFFDRADHPFDARPADARHVACRMEALHALAHGQEKIVVASARSLLRCLPPTGSDVFEPLDFVAGREVGDSSSHDLPDFESVAAALEARGYENAGELAGPGTFCVHGGAIDVYPGNLIYPIRLDFFGDEVEEILRIVPSTGQTISSLGEVAIFPVREFSLTNRNVQRAKSALADRAPSSKAAREMFEHLDAGTSFEGMDMLLPLLYAGTSTLCDFMRPDALTVLVEPRALFDDAVHAYDDIAARAKEARASIAGLYKAPDALDFGASQRCTYVSIMRIGGAVDAELPVKRVDVAGNPDKLFGRLRSLVDADFAVVFSAPDYRARQDMKLAFVDHGFPIEEVLDVEGASLPRLKRGRVTIVDVEVPLGMIFPKAKLALVSISDTQGAGAVRTGKKIDITQVTFPYKPGDYVVHAAHGVALFRDFVRQDVGGALRDYLLLEYAQGDKLYVPVEQLDRITRYVGPEGASPRLTRLNTSDWSRALGKARSATKKLAFDLIDVYTRRAATKGYRYSVDTPWQHEMEEAFPYQETADQLAAIADVKADMQAARPMDRLICGDVGFGKTEVALRAAFKATQDGKQVMVLCPTTILAQQHYTTFRDRFDPFDVDVEVLSRFRTPAQQRIALEGFASGAVDVLVGTHRLLSRDVNPHDLGLVIIDEEQRFGVGHKEQLKNLRESIDVLSLSATPIPRTLQMSLSGVRDMSLILTPPDDRHPVDVHVGEWDPDIVSSAIRRELARGGQVYYVSNRVRTIADAVSRVGSAAGEARIGVAHGKMSKEELEHVMEDFSAGELDVLVATTIIESGIDNPHTNTLIIEDSQRLGLAQMYQLKGRVGRSSTQAYAYFMFPPQVALTEEAMARLTAIDENKELGSGMRIAMRDLEIRGAGNMLGAEQSGNMSAVGFDLFAQMLAEAVNLTREGRPDRLDELPPALSDITVNLPVHAYISEECIADVDERVTVYRKIASAEDIETVDEVQDEVERRHGALPAAARSFFEKARIKARAHELGIESISVIGGKLTIEPIDVGRDTVSAWRRYAVRYVPTTRKLQVPLKFFDLEDDSGLASAVFAFLGDLAPSKAE